VHPAPAVCLYRPNSGRKAVWPPLELDDAATEAHIAKVIKIIFVANNDKSFFLLAASSTR
jgi:hypothetical protein